ncbi:hypothetical protein AAF712_016659 [Marasmius tenuissimus]|uniref:Uncharacterized protein n=1 Tax=Marasmius tenuissimus TaxID=585030 RepID=A0ABR2Z7G1_9AGAR
MIEEARFRHVADCAYKHVQETSLSPIKLPPFSLRTVELVDRLDLMGGIDMLHIASRILQYPGVRNLAIDWLTFPSLYSFLNTTHTTLKQLSSITLLPPSPLHPWTEYRAGRLAPAALDHMSSEYDPPIRTCSFFRSVQTNPQHGALMVKFAGSFTLFQELSQFTEPYWHVQELKMYPDPSQGITMILLSSPFQLFPYLSLTHLHVEDLTIVPDDGITLGALFPSIEHLLIWTTQTIPDSVFNQYCEQQFRSLGPVFSFEMFTLTQWFMESQFFSMILSWGVDLNSPGPTIIRLEETVQWCVIEIDDGFGWSRDSVEKVILSTMWTP